MNTPANTPAHAAARIAHRTPGRIRIEVPSHRGDDAFFNALATRVAQSGQVTRARANPAAASLVVEYGGPLEAVLAQLANCSLQVAAAPGVVAQDGAPAGAQATRPGLPVLPRLAAGADLIPMTLVGAAFGIVGLVQTARGEIMLPALSAFWYAASALRLAQLPASGPGAAQAVMQTKQTVS